MVFLHIPGMLPGLGLPCNLSWELQQVRYICNINTYCRWFITALPLQAVLSFGGPMERATSIGRIVPYRLRLSQAPGRMHVVHQRPKRGPRDIVLISLEWLISAVTVI